jgi:hypothetical protein
MKYRKFLIPILTLALILSASIVTVAFHTAGMASDALGAHAAATVMSEAADFASSSSPFGCGPTPSAEP